MRIAFDLDGVLADMHGALASASRRLFASADSSAVQPYLPAPADLPDSPPSDDSPTIDRPPLTLTDIQERRLWDAVLQIPNFWETLAEIEPGAIRRLAALATSRRWEVLFITSRPDSAGDTTQRQTQRWLEGHGFPLPSVFVVRGSRGAIAAALHLDVVVDDRPENCLDVATDSSARAILVWPTDNHVPDQARRLGIGQVSSVMECLDLLEQAEQATSTAPSLMDRLRSLLGMS